MGVHKTANGAYRHSYAPFLMPTYYVKRCSPVALPLGELSPQVTERELKPFSNLMPTYYVKRCSPLALPLGELSPQVTERVLRPFLNDNIIGVAFGYGHCLLFSVLAAVLGHLSQRERQGMIARYTKGEARYFPGHVSLWALATLLGHLSQGSKGCLRGTPKGVQKRTLYRLGKSDIIRPIPHPDTM